jgi:hypothetical protein
VSCHSAASGSAAPAGGGRGWSWGSPPSAAPGSSPGPGCSSASTNGRKAGCAAQQRFLGHHMAAVWRRRQWNGLPATVGYICYKAADERPFFMLLEITIFS